MKIVEVIINNILRIICVICIAFAILIAVGYKPVVIQSGSMSPVIGTGDLCLVHSSDMYLYNDIITYKVDDIYVTHRIVCDNNDGTFITQGDANEIEDSSPVNISDIVGKVRLSIPKVGYVYSAITTIQGKVLLCVAMFILGLVSMALESRTKDNNINEKEGDYENQET